MAPRDRDCSLASGSLVEHRALFVCAAALAFALGCGGRATTGGGPAAPSSAKETVSPETLRQNTVSVRVQAPDRIAALFQGIADRMNQKGKPQLAEFFEAQTGGAFGSGFLVKRGDEMFVVTNRHVVDFADEAEIALDGDEKTYPMEVVYTDAVYDLAVLAFGASKPRGVPGMRLGSGVKDLQTVIATGYPGLDGRPSYQITRGQVSNERFVADSRGKKIALIQHTAPIDPGSSGGPLTNESGAVVGVNFVKYAGRDNVYLAIPAEAVGKVLDVAVETKQGRRDAKWLGGRLGKACGTLVGGLRRADEPSIDVYDLITNDVVAEKGIESMDAVAKYDKDAWPMFFENPTAMMRIAIAMRLWKEAHGAAGLPVSCTPLAQDPNAGTVKLRVSFERGDRETVWRFEQGSWKLAAFDKMTGAPAPPPAGKPAAKTAPKRKPRK
jgi:serine protease Do